MPETLIAQASSGDASTNQASSTSATSVQPESAVSQSENTANSNVPQMTVDGVPVDGAAAMTSQSTMVPEFISANPVFDLVDRAGVVGWVLAAMALIGVVLCLYKGIGFVRQGLFASGFVKDIEAHLKKGNEGAAAKILARRRHPAAKVGLVALGLSVSDADERESASDLIASRGRKEIDDLGGGLRLLSAIAVLSPLLGLLGTVMGMIEAFQKMEGAGSKIDPSVLSGGIWLALLTTAIGLVVAIPATALHIWFQGRVNAAASVIEDVCTLIVNREELMVRPNNLGSNVSELRQAAE